MLKNNRLRLDRPIKNTDNRCEMSQVKGFASRNNGADKTLQS